MQTTTDQSQFVAVHARNTTDTVAGGYYWLIPVAIAIMVYLPGLNNFFVYDDFFWLHKAKTLASNPLQAFRPELYYFDPLVHAAFFALHSLFGLDPHGYQAFSILLHACNAFLVYRLACSLSNDSRSGLYASVIFASSATVADAVLWQSSAVDLLSTLFSLATMLGYRSYLTTNNRRDLMLSCLFFASALASKGTPVVLPLVLLYFGMTSGRRYYASIIPYALLTASYLCLMALVKTRNPGTFPFEQLDPTNVFMGLCSLFIPERLLAGMNLAVTSAVVVVLLLVFVCVKPDQFMPLRRSGVVIAISFILPFLLLHRFTFATADGIMVDILASPSHRIYLASVGSALLGGGVLRLLETLLGEKRPRLSLRVAVIALVTFAGISANEVWQRDRLWDYAGDFSRATVNGLRAHQDRIVDGSQLVLYNFNNSKGFLTALVKAFFDVHDVEILMNNNICFGTEEEPRILAKTDKSALFVLDSTWKVHDLSDLFRLKLLQNIQAGNTTNNRPFIEESIALTNRLNQTIAELTQESCVTLR